MKPCLIKYYNIASKFVESNSIARACFIFLLCTLMTSANKSVEKKNWKCYKTIGSYVSCAFIEIWSTWEVWRALKKLELLVFCALQTFRVLHISMNARWRMNQLLMVNWSTHSPRTTRADNNAASCSCSVSRSCNCNWRKMLQHHTATTWNSSVRFGFCRHFECVLLNTFC